MEILPNIPGIEQHVFGDIYFGYFVPTVLRGRSDAFQRDINAILSEWVLLSLNGGFDKFIERDSDFGLKLFGTIFRELCFSKILTTHPLESISTVWEVFWGVLAGGWDVHIVEQSLADCFNSTIREDEDQDRTGRPMGSAINEDYN
eukprot:XP_001610312.1 hypothetical protein [Babesia bovis T2Bo]